MRNGSVSIGIHLEKANLDHWKDLISNNALLDQCQNTQFGEKGRNGVNREDIAEMKQGGLERNNPDEVFRTQACRNKRGPM